MVIKAKAEWFSKDLGRKPGEYWLSNWADGKAYWDTDFYPCGKVTFSLKVGKKWRLIAGRIDFEIEFARSETTGITRYNQHYFVPNNAQRFAALLAVAK